MSDKKIYCITNDDFGNEEERQRGKKRKFDEEDAKNYGMRRSWLVVPTGRSYYVHFFGFRLRECIIEEWMIEDGTFFNETQMQSKIATIKACFGHENRKEEIDKIRKELLLKAPRNEQVLRTLLEFECDVVERQFLISQLLFLKPSDEILQSLHNEAILQLEKTIDGPLFEDIDQLHFKYLEMLKKLEKEKKSAFSINDLIIARKVFFGQRFTANTCVLEGNEMNLNEIIKLFNAKEEEASKELENDFADDENSRKRRHDCQEILGMKAALDNLAKMEFNQPQHLKQLNLELLKHIHELMFDGVEDKNFEDCGEFRDEQIEMHFKTSPYSPVEHDYVEGEMDKWFSFFNEKWQEMVANGKMHPVELAAIASFYFLHVHPWPDGNGRSSRLILNLILECYSFPPIIIQNAKRDEYMKPLEEDNLLAFIRCIAKYVHQTLIFLNNSPTQQ